VGLFGNVFGHHRSYPMLRHDTIFRVFVNSTFGDFIAERVALQEQVFSALRDHCHRHGVRFQTIDLRWPTSEEASLDAEAIELCLQELNRCGNTSLRPYFIVLLGNRYGGRSLPRQIPVSEAEMLLANLSEDEQGTLLRWYGRDDNMAPPEYRLRPRGGEVSQGRRFIEQESQLRKVFLRLIREVIYAGDPRRHKYVDSLSPHEILMSILETKDATHRVFCYFREIEGLAANEEAKSFRNLIDGRVDTHADARVEALKADLKTRLPKEHVFEYRGTWTGSQPAADVDALCGRVERDLRAIIDARLSSLSTPRVLGRELDEALVEHVEYAQRPAQLEPSEPSGDLHAEVIALQHDLVEMLDSMSFGEHVRRGSDGEHLLGETQLLLQERNSGLLALRLAKVRRDIAQYTAPLTLPVTTEDRVHFSVTWPDIMMPGGQYLLDVWAHLGQQRDEVIRRAREEAQSDKVRIKSQGPAKVVRGTEQIVRVRLEGLVVVPPRKPILWEAEIGNASFVVDVPDGTVSGTRNGVATIHVKGVKISELHFVVGIGAAAAASENLPVQEKRLNRVFVSYANEDNDAVLARIQGMQKIFRDLDPFFARASLRSGDNWRKRLEKELLTRDVLYLFWSRAASHSRWVDWEWRFAMKERGLEFIDPVPLASPKEAPPPKELADLIHFDDWMLAYMSEPEHAP
jgi:hypothetical protein